MELIILIQPYTHSTPKKPPKNSNSQVLFTVFLSPSLQSVWLYGSLKAIEELWSIPLLKCIKVCIKLEKLLIIMI